MKWSKTIQREYVSSLVKQSVISYVQLDPNTVCNNKCWYCPVRYRPYTSDYYSVLSISELDRILSQLAVRDGNIINGGLRWVHTGHYNEILLYPYFEDMLKIFRKYGFFTIIHSNGTALTNDKIRIIKKYPDVIKSVCLNIPAGNEKDYAEYTGRDPKEWGKIIRNIDYYVLNLPIVPEIVINVNGFVDGAVATNLLCSSPIVDKSSTEIQFQQLLHLFPEIKINKSNLIDRAGLLKDLNILDNSFYCPKENEKVIGCLHSSNGELLNSRMFNWVHINAKGNLFLCCDDYFMSFSYGNCFDNKIADLWRSESRIDMICNAMETICRKCYCSMKDVYEIE